MTRLDRKVRRRAEQAFESLTRRPGEDGKPSIVIGASQVEALAGLRALPIPPAAADAPSDLERDRVDPVAYRRARNRAKRERRGR